MAKVTPFCSSSLLQRSMLQPLNIGLCVYIRLYNTCRRLTAHRGPVALSNSAYLLTWHL